MKPVRLVVVALVALVVACGSEPTIDASSPEALRESLARMEGELSPEDQTTVGVGLQLVMLSNRYGDGTVSDTDEFIEMGLQANQFFPEATTLAPYEYDAMTTNLVIRIGQDIDGLSVDAFREEIDRAGERLAEKMEADRAAELLGLEQFVAQADGLDQSDANAAQTARRERLRELEARLAERQALGEAMMSAPGIAGITLNERARDVRVTPNLTFTNELDVPATNVFVEVSLMPKNADVEIAPQRVSMGLPQGTRAVEPGQSIELERFRGQPVQVRVPPDSTTAEVFEQLSDDPADYDLVMKITDVTTTGPSRRDWRLVDREEEALKARIAVEMVRCEEARDDLAAASASARTRMATLSGPERAQTEARSVSALRPDVLRVCTA